jgi:hypothetical protein
VAKPREKRLAVNLLCRMRHSDGWSDVRIRNVSSRGLGAISTTPPATGQYVEVRRGPAAVVARVVWRQGCSFRLRTQDKIDLSSFVEQRRSVDEGQGDDNSERRTRPRHEDVALSAERSRRASSILQYAVLATAALAAALIASNAVCDVFAGPLTAASRALSGSATDSR